jgi:hypothetical protein
MTNIDYTAERYEPNDKTMSTQPRRWRRSIVAAASGMAAVGALILATAPGAVADPFPECGASNPADCPPGSEPAAPAPWQVASIPNPGDLANGPIPGADLMPAPDVSLPALPPPCPRGMHFSFTGDGCVADLQPSR